MTKNREMKFSLDNYLDCFGRYRSSDPVCCRKCSLNLRCAIEKDRNERYEILEELVSASEMVVKMN